jgi:hypothetical protein
MPHKRARSPADCLACGTRIDRPEPRYTLKLLPNRSWLAALDLRGSFKLAGFDFDVPEKVVREAVAFMQQLAA